MSEMWSYEDVERVAEEYRNQIKELEKQNEEYEKALKENIHTMRYALSHVESQGLSCEDDLLESIDLSVNTLSMIKQKPIEEILKEV